MTKTITKTKDEIKRTTIKEEVFVIKNLEKELSDIEKQIKDTEKEPDEILTPNFDKFKILEDLNLRKKEIEEILA